MVLQLNQFISLVHDIVRLDSSGRCHAHAIVDAVLGYLSGWICVIFEPCNPRPAINPCWLKMKA